MSDLAEYHTIAFDAIRDIGLCDVPIEETLCVFESLAKNLKERIATIRDHTEAEEESVTYFVTVEWCNNGHRGIFCSVEGQGFPKHDVPHTELEMQEILGPFWMILSSESTPISVEELTLYCKFHPLDEYCGDFGIARKAPEEGEECQDQQPTI